jgi:RecA/RadA recombinase
MLSFFAGFGEVVTRQPPPELPEGVALGRLTEILGPPQSGKTTRALGALKRAAAGGMLGLFVDLTHTWAPWQSQLMGPEGSILVLRPPAERPLWAGLAAILAGCRARLLVLDAVDVLPWTATDQHVAGCMRLLAVAQDIGCALLCTAEHAGGAPGVAGCDSPLAACSSHRLYSGC